MIEITGLQKRFGEHMVLKDINMQIKKSAVVALLGPSGSGKSTLLRCINLLTTPDKGRIRVGDHLMTCTGNSTRLPNDRALARFRATTGMVFQHFNLFPHMTALQNVMEGPLTVLRTPKHRAHDAALVLLAKVGLQDKADQYPGQLSGGQKQRVAIARALAMQPKVMLFDEVTSALDPELVGEVLGVIRDLAKDGMTMVLVTHEMAFAREVADEVFFMRDGVILESGPPQEVIDQPQHSATRQFVARYHASQNGQ